MNKKLLHYAQCAKTLFMTEFLMLKSIAFNRCLSIYIWASCQLIVNAYFLPQLGITHTYGLISLSGCLAVTGLMDAFGNIMEFVLDLSTDKITYYYATLPLPSWLMFTVKMCVFFVFYFFYTLMVIPLGKLLLWNEFDLCSVNWPILLLAMIFGTMFYAALTLLITSFVNKRADVGNIWRTFIFPLWFLGGFGFTWHVIYQVSPKFAYLELFNPIIYISELYRYAILQSNNLINPLICCCVIIFFTIAAGWIGVKRLKKRCDFI